MTQFSLDQSVAIIGLGYVGLPLAIAFGHANIPVIGIDLDERKVNTLNQGQSDIPDVPTDQVAALVERNLLRAVMDYDALREVTSIFVCVSTPFDANKAPDLTAIKQAGVTEPLTRIVRLGAPMTNGRRSLTA